MPFTIEQFEGCLLGLACADAVASPYEGLTTDMIFDMGPSDQIVAHESGKTIFYTDDTQMMISVVQTLIDRQTIDVDYLATKFATNYHPDRGYGQGARKIINAIGFGKDWNQVASAIFNGEGSLGNGAAMRVAPIGLYFANDLDRVADEAAKSAQVTHHHPIGIDSARLLAVAASLAAHSHQQPFSKIDFLNKLRSFASTEEFQWQIDLALQLPAFSSLVSFGNSLEAHRSVMTSIICFADSPDDYSAAIARAIGQGDDVDTLAAMAGALAGARLGIQAVPTQLIDSLEDNDQGKSFIQSLARDCFLASER